MYDAVVIGSGPAGLSAALYLSRAGKNIAVIEKNYEGTGQIALSGSVENYPGFLSIPGEELGEKFRQQVLALDVRILEDEVTELLRQQLWEIKLASGKTLAAQAVIYAAGAVPKRLDVPGEDRLFGRGVSCCAFCDGSLYKGKRVAVVGGGDTALDDALYLSGICERVYLIHRREVFRGMEATLRAVRSRDNVEIITKASVREVRGDKKTEGILLDTGHEISISGLFVAIGSSPETQLIRAYAERDKNGYVQADEDGITGTPGLFVAGDIRAKRLRQVVTAVSDGANAAASAVEWLNKQ